MKLLDLQSYCNYVRIKSRKLFRCTYIPFRARKVTSELLTYDMYEAKILHGKEPQHGENLNTVTMYVRISHASYLDGATCM